MKKISVHIEQIIRTFSHNISWSFFPCMPINNMTDASEFTTSKSSAGTNRTCRRRVGMNVDKASVFLLRKPLFSFTNLDGSNFSTISTRDLISCRLCSSLNMP
ncbi:MAG: hypothetical protein PHH37_11710 [Paludibacter sp.]|nr:hypothetical protein [Paludibacter sp.]